MAAAYKRAGASARGLALDAQLAPPRSGLDARRGRSFTGQTKLGVMPTARHTNRAGSASQRRATGRAAGPVRRRRLAACSQHDLPAASAG